MTPAKATVAKLLTETAMPDLIQAISKDYKSQAVHAFLWRAALKGKESLRHALGLSRDQYIEEAA